MITVNELNQYGEPICLSYVDLASICSVEIEGLYEQSRHILYEHPIIQH